MDLKKRKARTLAKHLILIERLSHHYEAVIRVISRGTAIGEEPQRSDEQYCSVFKLKMGSI